MNWVAVLHFAFFLSALSFAVRDILWLRILAIGACGLDFVGTWALSGPGWPSLPWLALFVVINVVRITMDVHGERRARLSEEESELRQALFPGLTRLEFVRLLRAGTWREVPAGTVLTRQGEPVERILLVGRGRVRIERDGTVVAEVRDGQFLGEMSFQTGETASATAVAEEEVRFLEFGRHELHRLMLRRPSVAVHLRSAVAHDLARKLRR